ncbi:alpha/beta hydrolase [Carnobacterium alterfunditum]|uniref:alpha/beta hydrolase n=1 Tax=Carnobacterium alterfunditum TaxID=28230 RepID=UPI0035947395
MELSPIDYSYNDYHSLTLKATFYKSFSSSKDHTIIYLHGGGLLYGQRNDLPVTYINSFLEAGYHFLSLDYPLAPESPLREIYQETKKGLQWFLTEYHSSLGINSNSFSLFGRSAGAYLALLLAKDPELPKPEKIISFYGYHTLKEASLQRPNAFYKKYPAMPEKIIQKLIGTTPIANGPLQTRYALYLYARQTGKWISYLKASEKDLAFFSLTQSDLAALPPTFIAQSKTDQDIPFQMGQFLHKAIPDSYFFTVNDFEHDFDRQPSAPEAKEAYEHLITWLS